MSSLTSITNAVGDSALPFWLLIRRQTAGTTSMQKWSAASSPLFFLTPPPPARPSPGRQTGREADMVHSRPHALSSGPFETIRRSEKEEVNVAPKMSWFALLFFFKAVQVLKGHVKKHTHLKKTFSREPSGWTPVDDKAANGAQRSSSYRGSRGLSPWVAPLWREGEKPGCVETNAGEEMKCCGQINEYRK